MLTKDAIIAQLIQYDTEHPETLGAMADRREIYANRFLEMANATSVLAEKIRQVIGDGASKDFRVDHPFGLRDIIVSVFLTATGEDVVSSLPDKHDGYVVYHFWRPLGVNELTIVIAG